MVPIPGRISSSTQVFQLSKSNMGRMGIMLLLKDSYFRTLKPGLKIGPFFMINPRKIDIYTLQSPWITFMSVHITSMAQYIFLLDIACPISYSLACNAKSKYTISQSTISPAAGISSSKVIKFLQTLHHYSVQLLICPTVSQVLPDCSMYFHLHPPLP